MRLLLFLLFISTISAANAQINKTDKNNKKTGKWEYYLKNWPLFEWKEKWGMEILLLYWSA